MSPILANAGLRRGHCLCGGVRFEAKGSPRWVAHCHCESCRRATSAAMVTYAGYDAAVVTWSGEAPGEFQSSPGNLRRFCRNCGSPMSFVGARWPDEVHLFAASFEDPETLVPAVHVFVGERLAWLHVADGLPRFRVRPKTLS